MNAISTGPRIRTAAPADAAEIARVHVRSWQAAYRGLLSDAYLDGLRPEDRAARYRLGQTDPRQPSTIVIILDDLIRGFATFGPDPDLADHGSLFALYLEPEVWGRGLGRLLIAEARARLRSLEFKRASLWVLVGNERAQRFYRMDGWTPDGTRREQQVWGVTVDEVRYRTALNPSEATRA